MYLFSFIVFIFLIFISFTLKLKFYHPALIFVLLWTGLLFFHMLSQDTLLPASDKALLLILIGVVFFYFGAIIEDKILFKIKFTFGHKKMESSYNDNVNLKYKWMFILVVCAIFALIPSAKIAIDYLQHGGSLWTIRYMLGNAIIYNHTIAVMYTYLITPATYLVVPVSVYLVLIKAKNAPIFFILSAILLFLEVVTKAGRLMLLYYMLSVIVIFFLLCKDKQLDKRAIFYFVGLGFASIFILISVSSARDTSFIEAIGGYSITSITFFSQKLEHLQLDKAYGGFSWFGVLSPIYNAIELLTGVDYAENANRLIEYINAPIIVTKSGGIFNYFATAFFRFYGDGGTFGVALFSLLWGMISSYFFKKMQNNTNIRTVFCYNLMVYGIAISVMTSIFADFGVVVSLLLIYLITEPKRGST